MTRDEWEGKQRKEHSQLFGLADAMLKGASAQLEGQEIHHKDSLGAVRALLFSRIIGGVEAAITLAARGFLIEGDAMYRVVLESVFRLGGLTRSPERMFLRYVGEQFHHRRRGLEDLERLIASWDDRPEGVPSDDEIGEKLQAIAREQEEFRVENQLAEVPAWNVFVWAKEGGQLDFFHGKYVLHSGPVHHSLKDLERRLTPRSDGSGIETIHLGPESGSPNHNVLEALLLLKRGVALFAEATRRDVPKVLLDLDAEFEAQWAELAKV